MEIRRFINGWTLAGAVLVLIIITGGIVIAAENGPDGPLEIVMKPEPGFSGEVSVGGGVNNPGVYPFSDNDTLADVVRVAGGINADGGPARIELYVPDAGDSEAPQKVNINRAEAWLLEALPGVGVTRAQAIIEYRREHGPFRDIYELLEVEGIGETTFEGIRHLITVAD